MYVAVGVVDVVVGFDVAVGIDVVVGGIVVDAVIYFGFGSVDVFVFGSQLLLGMKPFLHQK